MQLVCALLTGAADPDNLAQYAVSTGLVDNTWTVEQVEAVVRTAALQAFNTMQAQMKRSA